MGTYIQKNSHVNYPALKSVFATVELLKSSVFVSLSCAARVYLSFVLIGIDPNIPICIASFFTMYSVYLFDRTLGAKEDEVNRSELAASNKQIGYLFTLLTFLTGLFILAKENLAWLAVFPFAMGYLYSKGIKIGKLKLKLKGGAGIKNIVVGLTWGVLIAGLVQGNFIQWLIIFIFYGMKVFINSAIDDFKDIKGDTLAGIKTLPVLLGEKRTHMLLFSLHALTHIILSIALLQGVLAFEPIIILYSFICGTVCIFVYAKEKAASRKYEITFFKDLESTVTVMLLGVANIV